ncbi:extracellular solute-binding protein [Streptomonospora nanhaiensis]|uniref:Arabinogalactan oligomer/maltooligosaccharide transport system substrate-binding protein n=1 Tax=Streptomonospora nanhaiensis TaxID=1323731 RepID=A0A853BLJ4_9ACTN|nr:maltose ABC transporter substrate-binding protein [Streptomonospora nanhaiensis]MBV2363069.1 maltose ABC transporter substrate-binding protein [Streptomonospora nanhaiensis]MBX9388915.1 maltose ABC transporter substrate-binding protein [Streptomonospora nanhaiensis]NYI95436.1 arabinogalactan oligomer/maltooligosaccharide transport system substrate-binding protein [Streptomonospora nanhaiensis]
MRIRRAGALAGTAALALAATACGGGADGAGQDEATMVIWADPERTEVLQPFAEEFGSANGIRVEVREVAVDTIQADFVTAHESGTGPDVLVGAHDWIGNLVRNGAIDPVELPEDRIAAFDEAAVEAVTYDGRLYGVPYAMENLALIRNTDLAPEAPESIEDMVETGTRLKADGEVEEALGLQVGQVGDPYHMQPFYTSGGGYLFGADDEGGYDPSDLGVGTPESVEAFERLAELGEEGQGVLKRSIDSENVAGLFERGETPYFITGPWSLGAVQEAGVPYDISPVPGFEDGEEASPFITVQAFFVASGSSNKVLAEEFVANYVADPELATALYEADPRPPALTEVLEQVSEDDPDVGKFIDAGENGQPMPAIPEMNAIWDPFGKAQAAVIGGEDPEQAVETAAEAIRDEIG